MQCEQLSREVVRHREQLEKEAHALKARLFEARNEGRAESHKQKEELAQTVNSSSVSRKLRNGGIVYRYCCCTPLF